MNQENHIITGYSGYSHIYAVEDRIFNEALFGEGLVLFDCYYLFEPEYLQDHIVRIHSGQGCYQGMRFGIRPNKYEDIQLQPFEAGMNRNDILCAYYHKEPLTGTETVTFMEITGDATTGEPTDPMFSPDGDGSLISGTALNVRIPLWRIKIRGLEDPTFERMPAQIVGQWKPATLVNGATGNSNLGDGFVKYKVSNGLCHVVGVIDVNHQKDGTTYVQGLPRAKKVSYHFAPTSGKNIARLNVGRAGILNIEWIVNISNGSAYKGSTWIDISTTYEVDE